MSRSVTSGLRFFPILVALAFVLLVPRWAHADDNKDRVQFGNDIVIHEGEEVQDAVCFFCSVENQGEIHGDSVVFFGNTRLRGKADGDVVTFVGNTSLGDGGSIGGDTVVFGGRLRTADGTSIGGDRVVFPFIILLVPLFLLAGVVAVIVWAIRLIVYRPRPVYGIPPRRV